LSATAYTDMPRSAKASIQPYQMQPIFVLEVTSFATGLIHPQNALHMRLVQFLTDHGDRAVGMPIDNGNALRLVDAPSIYALAMDADRTHTSLAALAHARLGTATVPYANLIDAKRVLTPLDHPDPAHMILSGTGLNHLGSAMARNAMHVQTDPAKKSDSLLMFESGVQGGKPGRGKIGAQPEWFYKGDGRWVVPPEHPLPLPAFALDGGEEAELTGLYIIGETGNVLRVGFSLGNEFSDHVLERQNYLYLAHSKLRACSFGPEVLIADSPDAALPDDVRGTVRIVRDGQTLWTDTITTGEANMSHSIANMEHHHFKYPHFRQPGDVHIHFFGASALSVSAGIKTQPGDVFEVESALFGKPLRNPLVAAAEPDAFVAVQTL